MRARFRPNSPRQAEWIVPAILSQKPFVTGGPGHFVFLSIADVTTAPKTTEIGISTENQ